MRSILRNRLFIDAVHSPDSPGCLQSIHFRHPLIHQNSIIINSDGINNIIISPLSLSLISSSQTVYGYYTGKKQDGQGLFY